MFYGFLVSSQSPQHSGQTPLNREKWNHHQSAKFWCFFREQSQLDTKIAKITISMYISSVFWGRELGEILKISDDNCSQYKKKSVLLTKYWPLFPKILTKYWPLFSKILTNIVEYLTEVVHGPAAYCRLFENSCYALINTMTYWIEHFEI